MQYYPQMNRNHGEARLITVNGMGKVAARPNAATLKFGVETNDPELQVAQQSNANIISQITQALIQAGVPEHNIQTADYYIFPEYDYVDGKQQFRGYKVTHILSVTVEDISQTGAIIDLAVAQGANRVSNIEFTLKNPEKYYQEALRIALGQALAHAQTIANTMQLNLDQTPVRIIERGISNVSPVRPTPKAEMMGAAATPIEPGEQEITAKVEAQFQYFS
ncbi:SIMPL domain-containing protein [Halobacillus sp. BBL2006]|uniref:SIMPL domain-containing protein n=1 Tax=Halobacillus sp. BBL2006 TaxID=1543706 RepID=UPI00054353AB|nr:SIMPL domain-containing protein [Halobacillus sp. BBL2006]KHE71532.1 hypothetical protein LD39_09315 [Halobacillus sp. BBL2006]